MNLRKFLKDLNYCIAMMGVAYGLYAMFVVTGHWGWGAIAGLAFIFARFFREKQERPGGSLSAIANCLETLAILAVIFGGGLVTQGIASAEFMRIVVIFCVATGVAAVVHLLIAVAMTYPAEGEAG